jgi:hypothetical protein
VVGRREMGERDRSGVCILGVGGGGCVFKGKEMEKEWDKRKYGEDVILRFEIATMPKFKRRREDTSRCLATLAVAQQEHGVKRD